MRIPLSFILLVVLHVAWAQDVRLERLARRRALRESPPVTDAPVLALAGPTWNERSHLCAVNECHGFASRATPALSVKGVPLFVQPQGLPDTSHEINTARTLWDGAVVLAHHLESVAHYVLSHVVQEPKPVVAVELGAGTGVAGLALASLSSSMRVVLTDVADVQRLLQANIDINQEYRRTLQMTPLLVESAILDWTASDRFSPPASTQLLIASDVIWLGSLVVPLLQTIDGIMHDQTLLILAYQERSTGVTEAFFQGLVSRGLRFHVCPDDAKSPSTNVKVYWIARNNSKWHRLATSSACGVSSA